MNEEDRNADESRKEGLTASTVPAAVEPAASKKVLDLRAKEAESMQTEPDPHDEQAMDGSAAIVTDASAGSVRGEPAARTDRTRWDIYKMGLWTNRARQWRSG